MGYIGRETAEEEQKKTSKVQNVKPNYKEKLFPSHKPKASVHCKTGNVTPDCVQTPALVTLNPGQTEEIE